MPTTQYIPFATAVGANTMTPASYAADPQVPIGNQPGVARSNLVNTTLRQVSVGVAGVAQFAVANGTLDLPDDGDPNTFQAALLSAIQQLIQNSEKWKTGDIKVTLDPNDQDGWLFLNGAFFDMGVYPALAAFGSAQTPAWPNNGFGSMQLPDYRGEFLRGVDAGRGVDPGRVLGSSQAQAIQAHGHAGKVGGSYGGNWPGNQGFEDAQGSPDWQAVDIGITGDTETRPRNVAVRYLIKT